MLPPNPEIRSSRYARIASALSTAFMLLVLLGRNASLFKSNSSFATVSILAFLVMIISLGTLWTTWRESVHYRKICMPENLLAFWLYNPEEIPRIPWLAFFTRSAENNRPFALISRAGTYVSYTQTRQYGSWAFPKRLEDIAIQTTKGNPHLFFDISAPSMAGGLYRRDSVESSRSILIPSGKEDEAKELIKLLQPGMY